MYWTKKYYFLALFGLSWICSSAQVLPDQTFDSSIHTVLIHPVGKPLQMPLITMDWAPSSSLIVSFDDFSNQFQNYYYTIELMDAHWNPVPMNPVDYIRGFTQNRITDYKISSIALQSYYHYSFLFPNASMQPATSGNYLLKVFRQGRGNELVFTRRFFVVEDLTSIQASVQEPFDGAISRTHQKVQFSIDVKKIGFIQPENITAAVIQNNRYQETYYADLPSFFRGTQIEYNGERDFIFPAGKEARWADLQSFRLRSDRIATIESLPTSTKIYLKPDFTRMSSSYFTFKDLNGNFIISNSEAVESSFQNDYAKVLFTFSPTNHLPFIGKTLYLAGALTNNVLDASAQMDFNSNSGNYEKWLYLKQGYYSYNYILRDSNNPIRLDDFTETEGNHWETENNYALFIYFRAPGARHDQIIGHTIINSSSNW